MSLNEQPVVDVGQPRASGPIDINDIMDDPNLDTEWNAILRKHDLIPPKPGTMGEFTNEELREMVQEVIQEELEGKPLDKMSLDELTEREDDKEVRDDDRELERMRKQRIIEMILERERRRQTFGELLDLTKEGFKAEVCQAPKDVWVVVHMYQERIKLCRLLNVRLAQLAAKQKHTKFMKIIATDCVTNFPDRNCPSILVYCNDVLKKQWMGQQNFEEAKLTLEGIEKLLMSIGALKATKEALETKKSKDAKEKKATKEYDDDLSD